ncbi:MAG: 16S rRNA (adenine(1518)-N(6)/adenine(1519)-N(6))-dimethyltransferase RsmA [Candidatus Margulisiibacteriota bacterium]|jgi:16S rRNA (adenine1518-N6/adenine1519-N6)-dimethyltransferase
MKQFKSTPTKKHYGQHWLIDKNILLKIIESGEVKNTDQVIEIGTGTGFLTTALAETAGKVFSYDIDESVQEVARENLKAFTNIELIHQDFLCEERLFDQVTGSAQCKVIANIPYNITTPIIERLIANKKHLQLAVLMVQKEIGDRLAGQPGTKAFGSLSIFVQYHFQVEKSWKVSPSCFKPPPNVDSLLVKLIPHPAPPVELKDEELFFKVVHAAFWGRRKTLRNDLIKYSMLNLPARIADEALAECGINSLERGENLSLEKFAQLANSIAGKIGR